jgi:nucleoside-diphosphate-sugar epimerase
MKILITGAAGGIGSTLGYELYNNGYETILLDNFRNEYKENLIIDDKPFVKLTVRKIQENLVKIKK